MHFCDSCIPSFAFLKYRAHAISEQRISVFRRFKKSISTALETLRAYSTRRSIPYIHAGQKPSPKPHSHFVGIHQCIVRRHVSSFAHANLRFVRYRTRIIIQPSTISGFVFQAQIGPPRQCPPITARPREHWRCPSVLSRRLPPQINT